MSFIQTSESFTMTFADVPCSGATTAKEAMRCFIYRQGGARKLRDAMANHEIEEIGIRFEGDHGSHDSMKFAEMPSSWFSLAGGSTVANLF